MPDIETTKMVNIGFTGDLLDRVDEFRFESRFPTRAEALRWLIQAALDKKLTPKAPTKKKAQNQ